MKRILIISTVLALISVACKNQMPVQMQSYEDLYLRDTIPYSLASHDELAEKLLIFLPPALDTVVFEKTDLYQKIFDAGYDILCVYQAPAEGQFFYSRKSMDFKGQHIQNVQNLLTYLRKQKRIAKAKRSILMGIEQGAYMTPLLMANNEIDTAIFINASPFSVYLNLQRIANGKVPFNEKRQAFIEDKFNIDSLHVFQKKVADVEALSSELFSLGRYPNMYWLSYHANYMLEEYRQVKGHTFWINYRDYPLFKESDWEYLQLLDKTRREASSEHYLLSDYQSYSEENWQQLEEIIMPFLSRD